MLAPSAQKIVLPSDVISISRTVTPCSQNAHPNHPKCCVSDSIDVFNVICVEVLFTRQRQRNEQTKSYPEASFLFHARERPPTNAEWCKRTVLETRARSEKEGPAAAEDQDGHEKEGVCDNRIQHESKKDDAVIALVVGGIDLQPLGPVFAGFCERCHGG